MVACGLGERATENVSSRTEPEFKGKIRSSLERIKVMLRALGSGWQAQVRKNLAVDHGGIFDSRTQLVEFLDFVLLFVRHSFLWLDSCDWSMRASSII